MKRMLGQSSLHVPCGSGMEPQGVSAISWKRQLLDISSAEFDSLPVSPACLGITESPKVHKLNPKLCKPSENRAEMPTPESKRIIKITSVVDVEHTPPQSCNRIPKPLYSPHPAAARSSSSLKQSVSTSCMTPQRKKCSRVLKDGDSTFQPKGVVHKYDGPVRSSPRLKKVSMSSSSIPVTALITPNRRSEIFDALSQFTTCKNQRRMSLPQLHEIEKICSPSTPKHAPSTSLALASSLEGPCTPLETPKRKYSKNVDATPLRTGLLKNLTLSNLKNSGKSMSELRKRPVVVDQDTPIVLNTETPVKPKMGRKPSAVRLAKGAVPSPSISQGLRSIASSPNIRAGTEEGSVSTPTRKSKYLSQKVSSSGCMTQSKHVSSEDSATLSSKPCIAFESEKVSSGSDCDSSVITSNPLSASWKSPLIKKSENVPSGSNYLSGLDRSNKSVIAPLKSILIKKPEKVSNGDDHTNPSVKEGSEGYQSAEECFSSMNMFSEELPVENNDDQFLIASKPLRMLSTDSDYHSAASEFPSVSSSFELAPSSPLRQRTPVVKFQDVQVFYFARSLGYTTVPEYGEYCLGMKTEHFSERRFPLSKPGRPDITFSVSEDIEEGEVLPHYNEEYSSTMHISRIEPKRRMQMLRKEGVILEKVEVSLDEIRKSRKHVGCKCPGGICNPATCECCLTEIHCQVDGIGDDGKTTTPCSCSCINLCNNIFGRSEFRIEHVDRHYSTKIYRGTEGHIVGYPVLTKFSSDEEDNVKKAPPALYYDSIVRKPSLSSQRSVTPPLDASTIASFPSVPSLL